MQQFTLRNQKQIEVKVISYGGIITSVLTPDKQGKVDDIVLGFDRPEAYQKKNPYFGAIIGRYGNRIAKGKFKLDGKEYTLAVNNGPNHLHGGNKGFDKVMWEPVFRPSENQLVLSYTSPNGEEGYPGTLEVKVTYTLSDDNELIITYEATADQPTPVNLTNHSYFNLAGKHSKDILGHEVYINADHYIPVDSTQIPTGEIKAVQNTPFDFRKMKTPGKEIDKVEGGYDHTFVLNKQKPGTLTLASRVAAPQSGRKMEVFTTQPGMQFYTGNFLDGSVTGKDGQVYQKHAGFCMETQHFPDSPNQPKFPSTILAPGATYRQVTVYQFGV